MTDGTDLVLPDPRDVADLATFVSRAKVADPGGAVRLSATGDVLALTVCVLSGGGLLGSGTVLGLRALRLAERVGAPVDVVVDLEAVADRLARLTVVPVGDHPRLAVPPVPRVEPWAALSPPRSGWTPAGTLPVADLRTTARAGIEELGGAGRGDRAAVWGRPLVPAAGGDATTAVVAAGVAFAAHALGLLPRDDEAAARVLTHGRWTRVSLPAGEVLAR